MVRRLSAWTTGRASRRFIGFSKKIKKFEKKFRASFFQSSFFKRVKVASCSSFVTFYAGDAPLVPRTFSAFLDRAPLGPGRGSVSPRFRRPFWPWSPIERVQSLSSRSSLRAARFRESENEKFGLVQIEHTVQRKT